MATEMTLNDHEKISIAKEYFIRTDQGRPDILELFDEDAEIYFPNLDLDLGGTRFSNWFKSSRVPWNTIRHDYESLTFIPFRRLPGG
jgi:hypothetical protein